MTNQGSNHDTERLTACWTRAQPIVTSYIASVIRNFADVEDVLQEVAMAVARQYPDSDQSLPFIPWALAIARHKVADYQRKHYHKTKVVFDDAVLQQVESAYTEIELEVPEIRRALDTCVERLQKRARQLMELRYMHGMKPAEIADRVGMTANSVSQALFRMRQALSDCIRARMDGGEGK
jgi:RNA polymerase sigma-70 factor (ECF subfamily)